MKIHTCRHNQWYSIQSTINIEKFNAQSFLKQKVEKFARIEMDGLRLFIIVLLLEVKAGEATQDIDNGNKYMISI